MSDGRGRKASIEVDDTGSPLAALLTDLLTRAIPDVTQGYIAGLFGLSGPAWNRYVHGHRDPTASTIRGWLQAYAANAAAAGLPELRVSLYEPGVWKASCVPRTAPEGAG